MQHDPALYDKIIPSAWRGVRVVEGAALEKRCGLNIHREFESLPLRHRNTPVVRPGYFYGDLLEH